MQSRVWRGFCDLLRESPEFPGGPRLACGGRGCGGQQPTCSASSGLLKRWLARATTCSRSRSPAATWARPSNAVSAAGWRGRPRRRGSAVNLARNSPSCASTRANHSRCCSWAPARARPTLRACAPSPSTPCARARLLASPRSSSTCAASARAASRCTSATSSRRASSSAPIATTATSARPSASPRRSSAYVCSATSRPAKAPRAGRSWRPAWRGRVTWSMGQPTS